MFELKVAVSKVLGTCTSDVPMRRGDYFVVRDGDITIPEGGHICLYALQNLLPVITPKERALAEAHDEDWMWRVRHVQCPDPNGRVIFTVDQVRTLEKADRAVPSGRAANSGAPVQKAAVEPGAGADVEMRAGPNGFVEAGSDVEKEAASNGFVEAGSSDPANPCAERAEVRGNGRPRDLRVVVERVGGTCTSGMKPGDEFVLRGGRVHIPVGRHFCLYALAAALPLLPAKQRQLAPDDWMATEHRVICPDPAGNVVLRIETL
jgi:uncharacterized repeat protein (TIGR04076 family)